MNRWAFLILIVLTTALSWLSWNYDGRNGFSTLSDALSLVGLWITVYVASEIRQLRTAYVRHIMLKHCHSELKQRRIALARALSTNNPGTVRSNGAHIRVALREAQRHMTEDSNDWPIPDFDNVLASDNRLIVARMSGQIHEIDDRIARISMMIERIVWEKRND